MRVLGGARCRELGRRRARPAARARWRSRSRPGVNADAAAAAAALRALLDAGVPVAEFSLEGGRLSDAFLEVVSE